MTTPTIEIGGMRIGDTVRIVQVTANPDDDAATIAEIERQLVGRKGVLDSIGGTYPIEIEYDGESHVLLSADDIAPVLEFEQHRGGPSGWFARHGDVELMLSHLSGCWRIFYRREATTTVPFPKFEQIPNKCTGKRRADAERRAAEFARNLLLGKDWDA